MRNRILLLLGLLVASSCCGNNESSIPVLRFEGRKGNIAKIKESTYDAVEKFGDVYPDDLWQVRVAEFDSEGFPVSSVLYDSDGMWITKETDTFENGRCVKSKVCVKYPEQEIESSLTENTKEYEVWSIVKNGETRKQYSYYEGLRIIAKDEEGKVQFERIFDAVGHGIDMKIYTDGEIMHRESWEYNAEGLLVKTTVYRDDGIDPDIYTYSYSDFDSHGNWTTQICYDEDGDPYNIVKAEITYR